MPKGVRGSGGLQDPVEAGEDGAAAQEMDSLDIKKAGKISFKPIPLDTAVIRRPFDGYPLRKFNFGDVKTFQSFIVALNPTVAVHQDRANRKVKQKDGTMEMVQTRHSRVIRYREINENIIVMFDRDIEVDGTVYQCAIVASHNVRAQICFNYDADKRRIVVDSRYMLLDTEQRNKLRQVYEQVINPKIKMERDAAFIAGESKEDTGGAELTPE